MKKEGSWAFKAFLPQDKYYTEYFLGERGDKASVNLRDNSELDLEMDSESTKMTDDSR